MSRPTSEQEVEFLVNLQRLLTEGQFVATYKFALLMALADIAVEEGADDAAALAISTRAIAEKFILYYWRQASPYAPLGQQSHKPGVLRQNTGRQAGIVNLVEQARHRYEDSLTDAMRDARAWNELVAAVNQIVKVMPLWKLQTLGRENFDFLYENTERGSGITLKPGVAYCLRKFHALVTDLVRGAWVRHVRRYNSALMGVSADLHEFLFGSERADLSEVAAILREIQEGKCFYCDARLAGNSAHVDHFVPWSRYPVDLGHNFVLAHQSCNSSKSDRLAAGEHLARWTGLLERHGQLLKSEFDRRRVFNDLAVSVSITRWAYAQTLQARGLTWQGGNRLLRVEAEWLHPLDDLAQQLAGGRVP